MWKVGPFPTPTPFHTPQQIDGSWSRGYLGGSIMLLAREEQGVMSQEGHCSKARRWRWETLLVQLLSCFARELEMESWCDEGTADTICTFDPVLFPVPGGKRSGRH